MESERRQYRRARRYEPPVSVQLSPDVLAVVEHTADTYGFSRADVLRQCVDIGLPKLRDRLRKTPQHNEKGNTP